MSPQPAAAASGGREDTALQARLRRFLATAPTSGREGLAARLLPAADSLRPKGRGDGFYWLEIARWLADDLGVSATWRGRELLDDLCWIQYCVYGVFRVQDDLVDGHSPNPLLAVEANRLLVEAARCAAVWFEGSSSFWRVFRDSTAATTQAIVALDEIQRGPRRRPHEDLDHYVDLAASLKIAAAGVASRAGREREWRKLISPALDRVAVAAQILDDVEDLGDDLAHGRINYAAWSLARPILGPTPAAVAAVVASNLATTDRLEALVEVPRRLLREAEGLLAPACGESIRNFLKVYRTGVDDLEDRIIGRRSTLLGLERSAA